MADTDDLAPVYTALKNADAAGDTASAQKLATYLKTRTATPAAAAPSADTAPREPTPVMTQIGHLGMDVAGTVARGVGGMVDVAQRAKQALNGEDVTPYGEHAESFSRPFQHEPDVPSQLENRISGALSATPGAQLVRALKGPAKDATSAVANSGPLGQTIAQDVAPPVSDIANAAATAEGAKAGLGSGLRALDTGINATAGKLQAPANVARVSANESLLRMRADGFKITANDARGATNAADLSKPNADLPGPSESNPYSTDVIQSHNQALATQKMAEDVGLPTTRNINPSEITARKAEEGKVYGQIGDAVGSGRTPTPVLDKAIGDSMPNAADPDVKAKLQKDVDFYRDYFARGFDGPDAVQTIRTLRDGANKYATSTDPVQQAQAATYKNIAGALEDELMRQLPANAQDLKTAFPNARQQLAKLYDLEAVSEGGQVIPSRVLQLKNSGGALTGAADAVANAASVGKESMQGPRGSPGTFTSATDTHNGLLRNIWNLGTKIVHAVPGLDPTTDAYQASRYGKVGGPNATPPMPDATPPLRTPPPVSLTPPPGSAAPTPSQGELPLSRAEFDQRVLDTIQRYRGELGDARPAGPDKDRTGKGSPAPLPARPMSEMTIGEALRKKLGEAMK